MSIIRYNVIFILVAVLGLLGCDLEVDESSSEPDIETRAESSQSLKPESSLELGDASESENASEPEDILEQEGVSEPEGVSELEGISEPENAPKTEPMVPKKMTAVNLKSSINNVQPMTGIVLWEDTWNDHALKTQYGHIQLEYFYAPFNWVVNEQGDYDWSQIEERLERIAERKHQAIIRFYYVYPGDQTTVPQYIKNLNDYSETIGNTEGQSTGFPDWRHPELQKFHLTFYEKFAERYDNDPRIAFLQVGFGLWGEYHIYDGPNDLGLHFPSHEFQTVFFERLSSDLTELHWSISIDAGDSSLSAFPVNNQLKNLTFGNFDDSFMHQDHAFYNKEMWLFFNYSERYQSSPHGGELSYYTDYDQMNVLNVGGMHGRTYEALSAQFHISYMIGNDQPNYQSNDRIKRAGMSNGYKFRVTEFLSSSDGSVATLENRGNAPIYYDAFPAVNGIRSTVSLKGLLPGERQTFEFAVGSDAPRFSIESDRLVPGQNIEFEANLPGA